MASRLIAVICTVLVCMIWASTSFACSASVGDPPRGVVVRWSAEDIARAEAQGSAPAFAGWSYPASTWPKEPGVYTFYIYPCSSAQGVRPVAPLYHVRVYLGWLVALMLLTWPLVLAKARWSAGKRAFGERWAPRVLDPVMPTAWAVGFYWMSQGLWSYPSRAHSFHEPNFLWPVVLAGGTLAGVVTWRHLRSKWPRRAAVLASVIFVGMGILGYAIGVTHAEAMPKPFVF